MLYTVHSLPEYLEKIMKLLFTTLIVLNALPAFATIYLKEGKYVGTEVDSNKRCSVRIEFDGDYLYHRRAEYRMTMVGKGPFNDCKSNEGVEFDYCGGGIQTNGNEDKSLLLYLASTDQIDRIEFSDSDFDSTNDITCVNLIKKD